MKRSLLTYSKLFVLVFVLLGIAKPSLAQDLNSIEVRKNWLADVVISLDGFSQPSSDWEASSLLKTLEGADVIALGEPTHGDGTAFLIRNRLTQLLHERMGFNTLALEALGLFDNPQSIQTESAARLWSGSNEARPGLDYAMMGNEQAAPMTVLGMDVQHRKTDHLWTEAEGILERIGILDSDWSVVHEVLLGAFSNPFVPVETDKQEQITRAVQRYSTALDSKGYEESGVFLLNALANASTAWKQSYEPRDRQMAENLLYMAGQSGEKNKIVLWAATSHAVKSLSAIDNLDSEYNFDDSYTVGQTVQEELSGKYVVVAFTACEGEYGASHIGLTAHDISAPTSGSLEDLVCGLPFEEAAYVDLRGLSKTKEGGWLMSPLVARPLGYTDMLASWPSVIDGLVVVRTMRQSTPFD